MARTSADIDPEAFHAVAKEEFLRLREEWGFGDTIDLVYNRRLTVTLGYCIPTGRGEALVQYGRLHENEGGLWAAPDLVRDIIRHEVAHALEWLLDGEMSHSARWRSYAELLGCYPRGSANAKVRRTWLAANKRGE